MIISPDLFKAILAMDSYNRGYLPGLEVYTLGTEGIGSANFSTNSTQLLGQNQNGDDRDQAADFYAIAYDVGGQTVISYRGTDGLLDLPAWTTGGGVDDGSLLRQSASNMTR